MKPFSLFAIPISSKQSQISFKFLFPQIRWWYDDRISEKTYFFGSVKETQARYTCICFDYYSKHLHPAVKQFLNIKNYSFILRTKRIIALWKYRHAPPPYPTKHNWKWIILLISFLIIPNSIPTNECISVLEYLSMEGYIYTYVYISITCTFLELILLFKYNVVVGMGMYIRLYLPLL